MGTLLTDLRYAVRILRKNPSFSLVAVAALALGIGANAAIFSVVNAVLLRPLPFRDADALVQVCRVAPSGRTCNGSIPKFMVWREAQSFDAVAAHDFAGPGLNLSGGDRPEQVRGIHVSGGYFRVFGVTPAIGRTFSPDEDAPGRAHVAVLSNGLWTRRFGADPAIVGRPVTLNGDPYTVIGVLAAGFDPDPPVDIFLPLQADPNSSNQGHFLLVTGRLARGVTLEAARAEMKLLGERFRRQYPDWMAPGEVAALERMQDLAVEDVRPALLILLGAVALVLLIACANAASLMLARSTARQKEVAVRAAVGAGRGAIVRQLLVESVLLAAIGAAAGVVLGVWGARALVALSPGELPRAAELARQPLLAAIVDWRVLAFTALLAVTTGVLFGIAPALHLAGGSIAISLREGGGHGSTAVARLRGALVVGEVALALVLLVGATLLIRTFVSLRQVDAGFDPRAILTVQTTLGGAKYSTADAVSTLTREVTGRLDGLPGVEASALTIRAPTEGGLDLIFRIEGRPTPAGQAYHGDEQWRSVSHEYFRALGMRTERGRVFDARDAAGATPVVVINRAMAQKYWPDGDPVGQRLTIGEGVGPEFEDPARAIVGIVSDVRETGLHRPAPPTMYLPAPQLSDAITRLGNNIIPMTWVVRVRSNPASFARAVEREFLAVDAGLAVSNVRTMDQVVAESVAQQNFNMLLLAIFGAIAVALAAIGVYGLMAYAVEQGRHEIGVRLALGAAPADVRSMIVGRGMRLALAGLVSGVIAAFGLTRALRGLLFGVAPSDPVTFVSVPLVLGAVAFAATVIPALRATRINPLVALRAE